MAFFLLTYVGLEVSIGGTFILARPFFTHVFTVSIDIGWIVTYIINERGGGPNSGYISSGYWGGLTVGRVALLYVNKKVRASVRLIPACSPHNL